MKKLLVIGAGFLQSFVIKRARSMGYYVIAVDGDENAVGFSECDEFSVIDIVDEEACFEYACRMNIDGVLTAATDYGVKSASYVAMKLGLPGLNYRAACLVKNKAEVRRRLYESHVDDTGEAFEIDSEMSIQKVSSDIAYPVMVKPCDGSGSRGASRVDSADGLHAACRLAMSSSITGRCVIEPFVFGREYGAESFVVNGEIHVLGIMKKWMTEPPYYAELGHAIPSGLSLDLEEKAKECIKRAIEALDINFGSVNMDFLVSEEGSIHIVDVGARMGGNMIGPCVIPYGTGIDYVGNMIRCAVGDEPNWEARDTVSVTTRLLAFDAGVVKCLPDFSQIEDEKAVEIYHHIELGDIVNKYRTNLDGCGYIVACREKSADSLLAAQSALDTVAKTIF